MSNLFTLEAVGPRVEAVELLQAEMPNCIRAAAKDVGIEGVKKFFAGYQSSLEEQRKAA